MLTKFFGQIKPKVRGTGPIHHQFPESFSFPKALVSAVDGGRVRKNT